MDLRIIIFLLRREKFISFPVFLFYAYKLSKVNQNHVNFYFVKTDFQSCVTVLKA